MEAKQKAISKAYGRVWEKVVPYTDLNGWVQRRVTGRNETNGMDPILLGFNRDMIDMIDFSGDGNFKWRLISLRGIDNNNGWVRCDERFPDPDVVSKVKIWDGKKASNFTISSDSVQPAYEKGEPITHWKPVYAESRPLY